MEILIGSAVSLLVQYLKSHFGTSNWKTMGILLVVSLAAAGLYTAAVALGYWEELAKILIVAGAFYAFVLQRFESNN